MSSITVRHGTEGPRHDPYSYTEFTVQRQDGRTVTLHTGLGIWAETEAGVKCRELEALALFERCAGITLHAAERAVRALQARRYRRHKCGLTYLESVSGYPGEHLTVCGRCGEVIDYHFNIGEVE
jgi:hypothetical protein